MDFEKVLGQAQDTLTVMANIQARQAAVLKDHSLWLETLQKSQELHDQRMAEHDRRMAEHDRKMAEIDQRLAEITEKLDGLIAVVDGVIRRPPPPPSA